jgi:hypothetical protein
VKRDVLEKRLLLMGKPIMTREEFMEYENYFNTMQYEKVVSYFNPKCTVEYMDSFTRAAQPTPQTVTGPAEFIENYKTLHENFREFLTLGIFLSDEKNMIVEFQTEFIALRDGDFQGASIKRGECFAVNQFCVYDFDENGKFSRIRISHHRVLSNDPAFKPLHSI